MKSTIRKSAGKSPTAKSARMQIILLGIILAVFCVLVGKGQLPSYNSSNSAYNSGNNYGYNKETVRFLKDTGISPSEARTSEEIIRRNCGEACE